MDSPLFPRNQIKAPHWNCLIKRRNLKRGLNRNEVVPFFQPIVLAQTHSVVALEILARWQRKDKSLQSPSDFLPLAEKMKLLGALDDIVSSQALVNQSNWETVLGKDIPLSLNVSVGRLNNPALLHQLTALGARAKNVSLEVLETNSLDDLSDDIHERIRALRDLGVAIEIDDFGTGKTSILALTTLRPNRLKLDRRLVTPAPYSKSSRQVLESIIAIAQKLDIQVTAEGVEDKVTADLMTEMGCNRLQGFYFCRPLPACDVLDTLQNWQSRHG